MPGVIGLAARCINHQATAQDAPRETQIQGAGLTVTEIDDRTVVLRASVRCRCGRRDGGGAYSRWRSRWRHRYRYRW
jgi:hypothetical protein